MRGLDEQARTPSTSGSFQRLGGAGAAVPLAG